MKRVAIFIDGSNTYAATKAIGMDADYRLLRNLFGDTLVRAYYYTAIVPGESNLVPLKDWLQFNGYEVVTKPTKEYINERGQSKLKGNMDIEMAVDALELAYYGNVTDIWLFTGDSDFVHLIRALQRRGVRVTVASTISCVPPICSDDLRRAADQFYEIADLKYKIGDKTFSILKNKEAAHG